MLELRTRKGYPLWGTGPALRIAAVAAFLAAACLRYRSSHLSMTRLETIQAAEYAFIFFASMALTAFYAGFAERLRLHRFLQSSFLVFPSAALLAAAVYMLGMYQFGGWDEGLLVHAATCYAQGFRPYVDFPCSMPPLFMAAIRCGIKLSGLRWTSLALIAATFTGLTALWIFALLRRASVQRHWALVITACVELSTMLVIPFWWFNNSSAVSVVLLILSALACLRQPRHFFPWMSLSLALAMVLASKPNDLPACLVVLALLATRDRWQWAKTLSACAAAAAFFLLLCYAALMPPLALLHSYVEIGRLRGSPLRMVAFRDTLWPEIGFQILFILMVLFCFAVLLAICARRQPTRWPILAVCAIAGLTSIEMICTNTEIKTNDLSAVLVAAAMLCLHPWEAQEVSAKRKTVLAGLLSVFLVMAGFFSVTHLRILGIGEYKYYEPLPTKTIQSGFFTGLDASPRLQRVLAQSAEALSRYPARPVFFGPRMEFAYAVFNQPLMRGMPLLWDPGNMFSSERFPGLLLTFQQEDPGLLIFLKDDYTRMGPVGFYIQHTQTYQRIDSFGDVTVYLRRGEVPIAYIHPLAAAP
jgi:hypothetical protein